MPPQDHPFYDNLMTIYADLISDITAAQDIYFADKLATEGEGRYFQGKKTPATPLDGVTLGTIDETAKPTDQLESWIDFAPQTFKKNSKVPYQIRVDVYKAPSGHGWIFTGELTYAGENLEIRHHHGTEVMEGPFDVLYIKPESTGP